jgi:hypothetical protein
MKRWLKMIAVLTQLNMMSFPTLSSLSLSKLIFGVPLALSFPTALSFKPVVFETVNLRLGPSILVYSVIGKSTETVLP